MKDIEDVINMIKDTLDDGQIDSAKDYLEQFKEYLHSKGITDSVDPIRHDQDAKEELAKEIYANNEYYQSEYEDWEAFMNSDDFEEENMRLWSKFGESKIKPYVSMYNDKDTGKMTYDVLDSDGKSAFKTKDKKAAMGFFNKNFDALRKGFDSLKDENVWFKTQWFISNLVYWGSLRTITREKYFEDRREFYRSMGKNKNNKIIVANDELSGRSYLVNKKSLNISI